MHDCHHPECTEQVPRGILACRFHWLQLPQDLRRTINDTWKHKRIHEYGEALREAREFWKGKAA